MKFDFHEFKETWDDTEPVKASQVEGDPMYIEYSRKYDYIMGIFRAALDKMEISKRALDLTTYITKRNPSNITVWWYREEILKQIGYDWEKEMNLVDEILKSSPKPYQAWNHRRFLDDRCEKIPDEKERLRQIINVDTKNFHAYSFFCWFAQRWNDYDFLLKITEDILEDDPTNNSALNFRYWVVENFKLDTMTEYKYAKKLLEKDYHNESAMNYIRGLVKLNQSLIQTVLDDFRKIVEHYEYVEIYQLLYTIETDIESKNNWANAITSLAPHKSNSWMKF